eukprot:TRINITY_DN6528_c0_g1_i1.p1 TRINITY_DN6528_c0_g1~~TRINITY_DN6528_c0_g1_i1.p1  ORF type:complete len:364 (+),score=40.07 TRINITY_DN6528_c0_g1_i1:198-1289(+)
MALVAREGPFSIRIQRNVPGLGTLWRAARGRNMRAVPHTLPDAQFDRTAEAATTATSTTEAISTGFFSREFAFAAIASLVGAAAFASWHLGSASQPGHSEAFSERSALNPREWKPFKLSHTEKLSPDTNLYRFEFDRDEKLGLNVASCLITRAPIGTSKDGKPIYVIRPYTPVSPPDAMGHFDLVVKTYPEGQMSQYFVRLKAGDTLEVKGPIPKLPYHPNMKRQIGMVAGGTGITPMKQVIDEILKNSADNTQVSLLYGNLSPDDVLLKDELDRLAASHPNFKVYYFVDKPDETWIGGKGYISLSDIKKGLPPPAADTLILVCGPLGMMQHISGDKSPDKSQGKLSGLLNEAGYSEEQVFKF